MSTTLLSILGSSILLTSSGLNAVKNDYKNINLTNVTDREQNILIGYWHNFDNAVGYAGGIAKYIDLKDVSDEYNVINISFMKVFEGHGDIPTFIPLVATHPEMNQDEKDEYFRNEIKEMQSRGKKIVLSLGGADAHISLNKNQQDLFTNEVLRLVDKFGFDGIDIDLEQEAIGAAENLEVITSSLKEVKILLENKGKEFIISMCPEFPYLKTNTTTKNYVGYLEALEGYYDYISPQFYNQGGDGVNIEYEDKVELGINLWWLPQNNSELKAEFLYLIAKYIVQGKDNFYQIDERKLAWGLPSSIDSAANGHIQVTDIKEATKYLANKDIYLKGLMTWSVNWDLNDNWLFANYYVNEFYKF